MKAGLGTEAGLIVREKAVITSAMQIVAVIAAAAIERNMMSKFKIFSSIVGFILAALLIPEVQAMLLLGALYISWKLFKAFLRYLRDWQLYYRRARHGEALIRALRISKLSMMRMQLRLNLLNLTAQQFEWIEQALRDYFLFRWQSKHYLAMPSRAANALWLAFIEEGEEYQYFSKTAFGFVLTHEENDDALPALENQRQYHGMTRCWMLAVKHASRQSNQAHGLPLLFALDEMLDLKQGYRYSRKKGGLICSSAQDNFRICLPYQTKLKYSRHYVEPRGND